jgi:hypothetical protein
MTTSNDRLEQIESILAELARRQAQTQEQIDGRLSRIEQVVESNARAIEAWSGRIDESGTRLEVAIADTVAMIADLGRQQQETDQRFEVFLQESRADRVLNESEHRAFRETFQTLLAEISRIWQRVS